MGVSSREFVTLFHTVRHLKPVQVYRRIWRRHPRTRLAIVPERRPAAGHWTTSIARESARTGPFRFRFLNQERSPQGWNDEGIPKLWLYNLHYFEAPQDDLIRRWVVENPQGTGNGWESYPLSLRVVNWIKWVMQGGALGAECRQSLATQADYLSRTIEYHLLANHLFANAKALVYAGLFFAGPDAERWLVTGLAILQQQIAEQILTDGGHFERSPMYHSIILEDLLDLVNLARACPGLVPQQQVSAWEQATSAMLTWLKQMSHPDGRIAFFNDATFGVAPEPHALHDYAARLGIAPCPGRLGESGYIRLEQEGTVVLFDAAPLGPDYQPGHAHADTLSFELSQNAARIIVNSGISEYEVGHERLRQRGTAAHSTVVVDGANQSEVWSAFRVGRRARPMDVTSDHTNTAEAAHDGYRRLPDPVIHKRRLQLTPNRLLITDQLQGRKTHQVETYFHLHPNASPEIRMDPRLVREERPSTYHSGFNLSVPNRVIVGSYRGPLPVTLETSIVLDPR